MVEFSETMMKNDQAISAASKRKALLVIKGLNIVDPVSDASLLNVDSFEIGKSEIVGIVGPSGAGKSVFALSLLGLIREQGLRIKSGVVEFNQIDMLSAPESNLNEVRGQQISMIFQDPLSALDPAARCYLQLSEPLRKHGLRTTDIDERIRATLERAGLAPTDRILHSYPTRQMSGGERQRVLLAMAIAAQPAILVADEPTTAMDPVNSLNFLNALRDLRDCHGLSAILISHDRRMVESVADRIVGIEDGRMVPLPGSSAVCPVLLARPRPARRKSEALLRFQGVSKTYGTGTRAHGALDGLALEIFPGESLGIVGVSGSGKSTFARLAAGLELPDGGTIQRNFERGKVQMVFQDPGASLNPLVPVGTSVAEPLIIAGNPTAVAHKRALSLLDSVGLASVFAQRLPRELSGGQLQRVCIARALAVSPSLLIADEPTTALDEIAAQSVFDQLRQLRNDQPDMSMIVISHDLQVISELCDRVAVFDNGQLVEIGRVEQVFQQPNTDAAVKLVKAWQEMYSEPHARCELGDGPRRRDKDIE